MKPESPYYNLKVYQFIRENGGWKNFIMVEIEKFPCKDSYEAAARERYYIETFNATLNKREEEDDEEEEDEEEQTKEPEIKKYADCIKSLLTVDNQYVSIRRTEKGDVPVFFRINSKEDDNIEIEIVDCIFYKHGDGSGRYAPQWENVYKTEMIEDGEIWNINSFDVSRMYWAKNGYMTDKISYFCYYRPEQYDKYRKN